MVVKKIGMLLLGLAIGAGISYLSTEEPTRVLAYKVAPPKTLAARDFECFKDSECLILAKTIFLEAENQSKLGKAAVGHVIMTRVSKPAWPNTISEVVSYNCQFEALCNKRASAPQKGLAWHDSLNIAEAIYVGELEDPTNGADHFLNPSKVKRMPRWTRVYDKQVSLGSHDFYRSDL